MSRTDVVAFSDPSLGPPRSISIISSDMKHAKVVVSSSSPMARILPKWDLCHISELPSVLHVAIEGKPMHLQVWAAVGLQPRHARSLFARTVILML